MIKAQSRPRYKGFAISFVGGPHAGKNYGLSSLVVEKDSFFEW